MDISDTYHEFEVVYQFDGLLKPVQVQEWTPNCAISVSAGGLGDLPFMIKKKAGLCGAVLFKMVS